MRKILSSLFAILIITVSTSSAISQIKAIIGGTLVNTDGSPPIENAIIIIDNNRITEAGAMGLVKIPANVERVDASGKWIIPGLIDAHMHFFQSGGLHTRPDVADFGAYFSYEDERKQIKDNLHDTFSRYLRSGITSVVDVGGPMWNFEVRDIANRTDKAPRVAVAGPLISPYQPPKLTTDDPPIMEITTVEAAIDLVQKLAAKKPDLIKIWYVRSSESIDPVIKASVEESHRLGFRVAIHATSLEIARKAVEFGADVLVHSVQNTEVDEDFIGKLKRGNVVYTSSAVVLEGYPEALSHQNKFIAAEYELANPFTMKTFFDVKEMPGEVIPERIKRRIANKQPISMNQNVLGNLKTLQESGAIIAAGTDAGNIGTLHGPSIFREFEIMAEAGMTPQEILVSATINGAKVFGNEKELGTIEKGKLADMVILNANPLDNIMNTANIHTVIKDGKIYPHSELAKKSNAELVQQQVNAYNALDIDAFMATYHPDIKIYNWTEPTKSRYDSREAMRARYAQLFIDNPNQHAWILNRIEMGNYVIDLERVTGRTSGIEVNATAVYEIKDGLIYKVWFLR